MLSERLFVSQELKLMTGIGATKQINETER